MRKITFDTSIGLGKLRWWDDFITIIECYPEAILVGDRVTIPDFVRILPDVTLDAEITLDRKFEMRECRLTPVARRRMGHWSQLLIAARRWVDWKLGAPIQEEWGGFSVDLHRPKRKSQRIRKDGSGPKPALSL